MAIDLTVGLIHQAVRRGREPSADEAHQIEAVLRDRIPIRRGRQLWQEGRDQHRTRRLEQRLAEGVLQFADVPGPRVCAQTVERVGGNFTDVASHLAAEEADEVLHQSRQVLPPLSQPGDLYRHSIEAVK